MPEEINEPRLTDVVLQSIQEVLKLATRPEWEDRNLEMNSHHLIRICAEVERRLLSEGHKRLWAFDISSCTTPAYVYSAYAGVMRLNQNYNPVQ